MDSLFSSVVEILHAIKEWMPNLFNIFTHSEMAIGLSLGMIFLGVGIYLYLLIAFYLPIKLELERLITKIERIKDTEDMVLNFSYIHSAMSKVDFIEHAWKEFLKTLAFPSENTKAPIRSTVSASEFFNMNTIEESGKGVKSYAQLPDIFVGVGLVLTFLGLVSGIYFASQGLGGTVDEAKEGLVLLLGAATFKFMTSIAGVGIAVLFSIGYNKIYNGLENTFIELVELVDARVLTANIETIAFAQHKELSKQTKLLEKVLKNLDTRLMDLEGKK